MDSVLHLIGIARKAGRLEIGEEPVGAAARARQARLILVAADAAENSARRAAHFAEAGKTCVLRLPYPKSVLGGMVGRASCAMLALTDVGLASALAGKLAGRTRSSMARRRRSWRSGRKRPFSAKRNSAATRKTCKRAKRSPGPRRRRKRRTRPAGRRSTAAEPGAQAARPGTPPSKAEAPAPKPKRSLPRGVVTVKKKTP